MEARNLLLEITLGSSEWIALYELDGDYVYSRFAGSLEGACYYVADNVWIESLLALYDRMDYEEQ